MVLHASYVSVHTKLALKLKNLQTFYKLGESQVAVVQTAFSTPWVEASEASKASLQSDFSVEVFPGRDERRCLRHLCEMSGIKLIQYVPA